MTDGAPPKNESRKLRGLEGLTGGILSPGGVVICLVALVSSVLVFLLPVRQPEGLRFWTFARQHKLMYDPSTERWNEAQTDPASRVNIYLLSGDALQRRLLSGFLSGTLVPDLAETYATIAAQAFKGPLEDVGFTDLTDRLHAEGLYDQLNEPSFGPWTSRGRIFGLPHDVHPVLLAYRADLIEAAGIDMSAIETWDDFVRVLRPLVRDTDGDGYIDHYLLNIWETNPELIGVLMLQAGGGYFNAREEVALNTDINARVLATVVSWLAGPDRIAANAPEFDAAGNKMRLDGYVLCNLVPDWLSGLYQIDLPQLEGKMKLMPLPAWEPGGRRTSVMGGTMLGIPRRTEQFEKAWAYAKDLYLSREVAIQLFDITGIVTPVKTFWSDPIFDRPNPYYSGQPVGRLYLDAAPDVPPRTSSAYNSVAEEKLGNCANRLKAYAIRHERYTRDELLGEARRLLAWAEGEVKKQIDRNVFLRKDAP